VTLPTDVDYILIDAIQKRSDYIEVYDVAFPDGTANIKLNMKCGYSATPGLFKSIVIKEVAKAYKMSVRGGGTGEGSRTFSQTGASISSSSGPLFELEEGDKHMIEDGKYVWYDSPIVGLTR
jgi:hypothetical protein